LCNTTGCSVLSGQDNGSALSRFAYRQALVLALGGSDGLEEFNDRERTRNIRLHGTYHPQAFQERPIEAFTDSDKWQSYDRVSKGDASSLVTVELDDEDALACNGPLTDSVICR